LIDKRKFSVYRAIFFSVYLLYGSVQSAFAAVTVNSATQQILIIDDNGLKSGDSLEGISVLLLPVMAQLDRRTLVLPMKRRDTGVQFLTSPS